jgi:DNA-binding NtrC family response regulator
MLPNHVDPHVVLVSPDVRFLKVVSFLLHRAGVSVVTTRHRSEIRRLLEEREVSGVILDSSDSLAEAMETLVEIEERRPSTPVYLVTERVTDAPTTLRLSAWPKWGPFEDLVRNFLPGSDSEHLLTTKLPTSGLAAS